jgi:hypothetical protein
MSYFEVRPVVTDIDADIEIEASVRDDETFGMVVRLTMQTRDKTDKPSMTIHVRDWKSLVKAVNRAIAQEQNS